MKRKYFHSLIIMLFAFLAVSCQDDANNSILQNDCIKRSLGPNIVGSEIEFAYAMALPSQSGKIISAQVEASITGASGTWLENKSYYTNSGGTDIGIEIGAPSVNSGNKTEVAFTVDTCAATLRYYYYIPEEARGKEVSFVFSATASNGETVSYQLGPYTVCTMDMQLDMTVSDNDLCYISIEDMAVYNAANAPAAKIDLVYLYRSISDITFGHAFVAPGTSPEYLADVAPPAGATSKTKLRKVWELQDRQLARIQYGVYVDDPDFVKLDMTGMPDYAINMKAESGIWVETEDGRYRAYIYVNSIDNSTKSAIISMKRYKL